MNRSCPVDAGLYPATAYLLDQIGNKPPHIVRPHGLRLSAVTDRAMNVTSLAMEMDDHATASLMAEAFSRLALTPCGSDGALAHPNDRRALKHFALALIKRAYPHAAKYLGITVSPPNAAEGVDADDLAYMNDLLAEFDYLFNGDEGVH